MLIVFVGLLVAFGMFVVRVRAGAVDDARSRLAGPLLDMLVFGSVFAAAILYRRKPAMHKRLMIVAAAVLLAPAVGRMRWFLPANMAVVQLVWSSPILVAMAYDYIKERTVHIAYVIGLVVLMAESAPTRLWIRGSDVWDTFSGWLAAAVQ